MQITRVERWILSNQFAILAKLEPQNASWYQRIQEALSRGYELEYGSIAERFVCADGECFTAAECAEVLDVLQMYQDMRVAFDTLQDKSGIDPRHIEFPGFCGNKEVPQLLYCRYFCSGGRFTELRRGPDDFNSHIPMMERYRRMLAVYRIPEHRRGEPLNRDQIMSILEAAHPESIVARFAQSEPEGSIQ